MASPQRKKQKIGPTAEHLNATTTHAAAGTARGRDAEHLPSQKHQEKDLLPAQKHGEKESDTQHPPPRRLHTLPGYQAEQPRIASFLGFDAPSYGHNGVADPVPPTHFRGWVGWNNLRTLFPRDRFYDRKTGLPCGVAVPKKTNNAKTPSKKAPSGHADNLEEIAQEQVPGQAGNTGDITEESEFNGFSD